MPWKKIMKRYLITFAILITFFFTQELCANSKMLIFIPAIVTTAPNIEVEPHQIYPLSPMGGSMEACADGNITHASGTQDLMNSYSRSITIVEMTIIDPSTWQFTNNNSIPITLEPGDIISYSTSNIEGFLCENPPDWVARVKFVFIDGNFQNL